MKFKIQAKINSLSEALKNCYVSCCQCLGLETKSIRGDAFWLKKNGLMYYMDGHTSEIIAGITLALKLFLHRGGAREEKVTEIQKEVVAQYHAYLLSPSFVLLL